MEEKLTMNDGTVLEGSSAILSGDLFLYLNGVTFGGAYVQLSESRKTKKITYTQNNGDKVTFSGYTRLMALRDDENGTISAVLRKEAR